MISCLTEQLNGESCSSVAECLVTGAICNGGTCECPDTLYLQGTSCMDSKYCFLHSGKSATIPESNHGLVVYKEHYA